MASDTDQYDRTPRSYLYTICGLCNGTKEYGKRVCKGCKGLGEHRLWEHKLSLQEPFSEDFWCHAEAGCAQCNKRRFIKAEEIANHDC